MRGNMVIDGVVMIDLEFAITIKITTTTTPDELEDLELQLAELTLCVAQHRRELECQSKST